MDKELKKLAQAVVDWWEVHQYDVDTFDSGGGYIDGMNRYDEEPRFVTLAKKVLS